MMGLMRSLVGKRTKRCRSRRVITELTEYGHEPCVVRCTEPRDGHDVHYGWAGHARPITWQTADPRTAPWP